MQSMLERPTRRYWLADFQHGWIIVADRLGNTKSKSHKGKKGLLQPRDDRAGSSGGMGSPADQQPNDCKPGFLMKTMAMYCEKNICLTTVAGQGEVRIAAGQNMARQNGTSLKKRAGASKPEAGL
ncbi:hypothetical protein Landi51_12650 [Colletotrichum acutatum]